MYSRNVENKVTGLSIQAHLRDVLVEVEIIADYVVLKLLKRRQVCIQLPHLLGHILTQCPREGEVQEAVSDVPGMGLSRFVRYGMLGLEP